MLRFYLAVAVAATVSGIFLSPAAAGPASPAIAVVVGQHSSVMRVSLDELREIYLRRQRLWPNGERVIAINLPPDSPVREQFSTLVLGRTPRDLASYWNGRYFEGIIPPIALPSPSAVRAYLNAEPTAIGYIPVSEVDDSCRILLVLPQ